VFFKIFIGITENRKLSVWFLFIIVEANKSRGDATNLDVYALLRSGYKQVNGQLTTKIIKA